MKVFEQRNFRAATFSISAASRHGSNGNKSALHVEDQLLCLRRIQMLPSKATTLVKPASKRSEVRRRSDRVEPGSSTLALLG
jgi:hypothetical protein